MDRFQYGRLKVQRYPSRAEMGKAAGEYAAQVIRELLKTKERVNILFPAAPSQDEVLAHFAAADLDFTRIVALHMDEYIGLAPGAPQTFGHYLDAHLFSCARLPRCTISHAAVRWRSSWSITAA